MEVQNICDTLVDSGSLGGWKDRAMRAVGEKPGGDYRAMDGAASTVEELALGYLQFKTGQELVDFDRTADPLIVQVNKAESTLKNMIGKNRATELIKTIKEVIDAEIAREVGSPPSF